jgi:hypothetical protein
MASASDNYSSVIGAATGVTIANVTINASTTGNYENCINTVNGDFTMASGVLNLSSTGTDSDGIHSQGNVSISGTAQVSTGTSTTGVAMYAYSDVEIGGAAVVNVESTGDGGIVADGGGNISGGTVTAKSTGFLGALCGIANGTTVTGGTLTTVTGGGNIRGNLTVSESDGTASVTVNGNITNGGNLVVSAGTVSVTGTVGGGTNVTGGTVTVNGSSVMPVPAITSANSTAFTVGTAGTFTVTASNSPTSFSQIGVALPGGVTFDTATGILSGTPAAGTDGTYALTFTATNLGGSSAPQNFTLTVNPAGTTTPPGPTGSGGGCDAGFGALGALAALFAVSMGHFYKKSS